MKWLRKALAWLLAHLRPAKARRQLRGLRIQLEAVRDQRREGSRERHEHESQRLRQAIQETRAESAELAAMVDASDAKRRRETSALAKRVAQMTPPPRLETPEIPPLRARDISVPDLDDDE